MTALRILLTGAIYLVIGPLITLFGYRMLQPPGSRSLETGLVFLDTALFTVLAFAAAGLLAGAMATQGFRLAPILVATTVIAGSLTMWLVPLSVSLLPYCISLLAGSLLAGFISYFSRLLRPPPLASGPS